MTGGGEETAMLRPIAIATAVSGTLDIFWAMILTMTVGKGDIPAMGALRSGERAVSAIRMSTALSTIRVT